MTKIRESIRKIGPRRGLLVAAVVVAFLGLVFALLAYVGRTTEDGPGGGASASALSQPPNEAAAGSGTPEEPSGVQTAAGARNQEPPEEEPDELRREALALQSDQKWCEAEEAWQRLLERIGKEADHAQLREEAERNLEIVAKRCRPSGKEEKERELPPPEPEDRPEPVEEATLLDYYPLGRTVRQVALTDITGQGSNKKWLFQQDAYFAYTYYIAAETKVVKERPLARTFRITFHEVRQTRAVYDEALQLRPIDSPIAKIFFEQLDGVLRWHPGYRRLRGLYEIGRIVDPQARRTLTWFNDRLRAAGIRLVPEATVDLALKIEDLEGTVVEVEYMSGLGVSYVRIIEGERRDREDLERLAYTTSLLMDYYIFPNRDAPVGSRWEVRAEDVAAMIPFGYGYRPTGRIGVQRGEDGQLADETVYTLEIDAGSTVQIESRHARSVEEATARVISGTVEYCPKDLLVRRARIAWDGTTTALSKDHLLFGTESVRNVKVNTYYEAYRPEEEQERD